MFGKGFCQHQRHDEGEDLLVPGMRQRHVEQAEHQDDPRHRQFEPAQEGEPDQSEHGIAEEGPGAEIGRHPFRDHGQQLAEVQDFRRAQQRVPAIGCAAAGRERGDAEQRPSPGQRHAVLGSTGPERFQPDRSDQRQSQHEAAMQIGPQRQHRQQQPRRRRAAIGGRHQPAEECHHERERQHMRPRQEVGTRYQHRQRHEEDRARRIDIGVEQIHEDRDRGADRKRGQDHRPGPVQPSIGDGVEHLRQPGARHPGFAEPGERMDVGVRHRAMLDDPLPDPDLPQRVGIPQQDFADRQEDQIEARTGQKRDQRAHEAADVGAIGGRMGDGNGHLHSWLDKRGESFATAPWPPWSFRESERFCAAK